MRVRSIFALVCSVLLLAACSSNPPKNTAASSNNNASTGAGTSGYEGTTSRGAQPLSAEEQARQEVEKAGMIIYFDYDKSDIKPEYASVIAAHAKYLNSSASRKARLEGHTDERGSREYNIGLGERRAQAVRRALLLQGVPEAQLTTVSYGEERPAVQGSDETAYAKNRRVEIAY